MLRHMTGNYRRDRRLRRRTLARSIDHGQAAGHQHQDEGADDERPQPAQVARGRQLDPLARAAAVQHRPPAVDRRGRLGLDFPGSSADTSTRTRSPSVSPKRRCRPSTSRPRSKSPRAACRSASLSPVRPAVRSTTPVNDVRVRNNDRSRVTRKSRNGPFGPAQLGRHHRRLLGGRRTLGRPDPREAVVLLGRADHLPPGPAEVVGPEGGAQVADLGQGLVVEADPGVDRARPVGPQVDAGREGDLAAGGEQGEGDDGEQGPAPRPSPLGIRSTVPAAVGPGRDEGPGALTPGPSAELLVSG